MRLIIKLKDETYINIPADAFDFREDWVIAWLGEDMVAAVKEAEVVVCYLCEKKET